MNRFSIPVAILGLAAGISCGVKRTVTVAVPPAIREAKTATLEELLDRLEGFDRKIRSMSSNALRVTFTSGTIESGKLQEYRSAPGYLLMQRPDSIRVNIQNPVTKTTILDLLSVGDDFSLWYPRENKVFMGRNSARELEVEGGPSFTVRPIHMLEALLPGMVEPESESLWIALEEDQDATAKYYILTSYEAHGGSILYPVRRLWIDRSNLLVSRKHTFGERGALASVIQYSDYTTVDAVPLPLSVRIERPADAYSLDLRFKSWRLNPDLPLNAFALTVPGSAERVELKEKAGVP